MYLGHTSYYPDTKRPEKFSNGSQRPHDPPPDYGGFSDIPQKQAGSNDDSLDSTGKAKSFKRLVERFAEKTSMQGVPYINSAKLWYAKLLWTILLIACTAGMSLHLYYLISQFLEWPVQTKIKLGFNNLHFPAVTICNVNHIRSSQVHRASQRLQSLLNQMDWANLQTNRRRRKRFVDEFSQVNTSEFDDFEDNYDFVSDEYEFGTEVDTRLELLNVFKDLYRDEDRDTRIEMGHHLEDMLISCTIGMFKCYASNFTLLQHEDYGNCYTIQSNKLKIAHSGPINGLSLVLYMNKEEYLKQINEGYGARVLIHDRGTYPFPAEEGIFVPSSSETQIGVRMVVINRKDGRYGNCTHDNYTSRYGFKYTRQLCQILCVQERIFTKCGCYEDDVNEINFQIKKTNLRYCETRNEIKCMMKELALQDKQKINCKCQNPCTENQFTKTISHRNWPTDDYMFTVKDGVCDRLPEQCTNAQALYDQTDDFKKGLNYVKINIFFEDLNYEEITETPEIETAQFASDVGGAVGLWIGLSFLSMFEVVQLCLECCAYGVHKCRGRKRKRNRKRKKKQAPNIYLADINTKSPTIHQNSNGYFPQNGSQNINQNSRRYPGLYGGHVYDYVEDEAV